jgi:hypothetical protein
MWCYLCCAKGLAVPHLAVSPASINMQLVSVVTFLVAVTTAIAAPPLQNRSLPTGTVTCGSDKYSVSAISAAITQGYKYYQQGSTVGVYSTCQTFERSAHGRAGSDAYPHQYRDDEGLSMYCSGTYYEVHSAPISTLSGLLMVSPSSPS